MAGFQVIPYGRFWVIPEDEKRICDRSYFPIYFWAAVPDDMFSQAELDQVLRDLGQSATEADVDVVFKALLDSIPAGHPRRGDALWKLGRGSERLDGTTSEWLAYATAVRASDYQYGFLNLGEAAYALNLGYLAAQKVSTSHPQRVLDGAMGRASDDTFAVRLLEFVEQRERNKILTDFSKVDVPGLTRAFMRRMRERYDRGGSGQPPDLAQADWWAFRRWAENSDEDRLGEQDFWRRFIGASRKRLAQGINFVYPDGFAWDQDPSPIVDVLFPLSELSQLLGELPHGEELDETEKKGLARIRDLIDGKFRSGPHEVIADDPPQVPE